MANTIEEKLNSLYDLQSIDSKLDELRLLRGELPMEVKDLEDELEGLNTRLEKINSEIELLNTDISNLRLQKKGAEERIKKNKESLNKVKNNREFEALSKENEIKDLEMQAADKKIGQQQIEIKTKEERVEEVNQKIADRRLDLENKIKELEEITKETEKEENKILKNREKAETVIEGKLLSAYHRIRKNVLNGIAVAPVLRGACGGCFAQIPPQLQSDIRQRKKIVICENCGRVLVDAKMAGIEESIETEKPKTRGRRKKKD